MKRLLLNSSDFNLDPKLLINIKIVKHLNRVMRANAAEIGIQSFIRIYFVKMLQLMYDPVIRGVVLLFQVIKGMAYKMPSFILSHQYTTCFS